MILEGPGYRATISSEREYDRYRYNSDTVVLLFLQVDMKRNIGISFYVGMETFGEFR